MSKTENGNMIQVTFFAFFMGFCVQANAAEKIETVEVTGMGATQEKAIKNATKEAVRQVVGMYVVSEAVTKNRKLIKDEVLSVSNGFVRKLTTLEKEVDEDGIHMVTAKVEVEVGKLTETLTGLNIAMKKIDTDSLTAELDSKAQEVEDQKMRKIIQAEAAKDFEALAHKVIFEPFEKNKGIYKIDLNFFTGLVNDDDFDKDKWLWLAKYEDDFKKWKEAGDDWVPIQMTMKVSIKDAYFDAVQQFLDKNSKKKIEDTDVSKVAAESGQEFCEECYKNMLAIVDPISLAALYATNSFDQTVYVLGKQNAKSMFNVNRRFAGSFMTYLKLTLLDKDERKLGNGVYVPGGCDRSDIVNPPSSSDICYPCESTGLGDEFIPITNSSRFPKPRGVFSAELLSKNRQGIPSDELTFRTLPSSNILTTRFFVAGKKMDEYDFKANGKVGSPPPGCPGSPRAARMLGYTQYFPIQENKNITLHSPKISGLEHKLQNVFYKGMDIYTWYSIIFLPPEAAKHLSSAKVEIITVSLED